MCISNVSLGYLSLLSESVVQLPVIADVADGAIEVAEELPFELIAALVAPQIIRHHLLVAGRVVQIGHRDGVDGQREDVIHRRELQFAFMMVNDCCFQLFEGRRQAIHHVSRALQGLNFLDLANCIDIGNLSPVVTLARPRRVGCLVD
mmetsp:Transcript_26975/g.36058  ORF Transcript_26975/g.36058 Transcript_26975/m.36058 type:complete len:148 (-) Transcript_26975:1602-2045(-)